MRALNGVAGIVVGVNEPYSPTDRVYYTLERHARPRNTPCAMIELRNNEITNKDTQDAWAARLATIFTDIAKTLDPQLQLTRPKA